MGVPFSSWSKKLPRRTATQAGGRPTRESAMRNATLEADTRNYAALVRENIYCENCKKCFFERKKLVEHRQRCSVLKAASSGLDLTHPQPPPSMMMTTSRRKMGSAISKQRQQQRLRLQYEQPQQQIQQQQEQQQQQQMSASSESTIRSTHISVRSDSPINFNFLFD